MRTNFLFVSVAVFLFVACNKDPLPSVPEPSSRSKIILNAEEAARLPLLSENYSVSHDQAETYALSLVTALKRNGTATKAFGTVIVIDSLMGPKATMKSNVPQAKIYVVGLGNGDGFVLTPGDRRVPERILGYADEGTFADAQEKSNFNYAMKCLTNYVASEIERVEELRGDSVYLSLCGKLGIDEKGMATKSWAEDHNGEFTNIRTEPTGSTWTELGPRLGPLLTSKWNQYYPYNEIIKQNKGQNYPAGCVATAVGQIMNYHKHGTYNGHTYRWNEFSVYGASTDAGILDIGQLFWALGMPANLNMNYKLDGSGAYSRDVPRTFANFGYSSGKVAGIGEESINSSVIDGRPVYASGQDKNGSGGHAWVIDGSEAWHTYQNYNLYYYNMFGEIIHEEIGVREEGYPVYGVHCNWGWSGSGDGWFSTQAFKPYGYNYEYNNSNEAVYGIRPL